MRESNIEKKCCTINIVPMSCYYPIVTFNFEKKLLIYTKFITIQKAFYNNFLLLKVIVHPLKSIIVG